MEDFNFPNRKNGHFKQTDPSARLQAKPLGRRNGELSQRLCYKKISVGTGRRKRRRGENRNRKNTLQFLSMPSSFVPFSRTLFLDKCTRRFVFCLGLPHVLFCFSCHLLFWLLVFTVDWLSHVISYMQTALIPPECKRQGRRIRELVHVASRNAAEHNNL